MHSLTRLMVRLRPACDHRRLLHATFVPLCDKTRNSTDSKASSDNQKKTMDYEEVAEYFDERPETAVEGETKAERFRRNVPIPLTHGARGVYEVEDLVVLLRHEGIGDICTLRLAEENLYTDYMVIGSYRSRRQAEAVLDIVRKVFKLKMNPEDNLPNVEGRKTKKSKPADWLSLDLGNIVLHLILPELRAFYDLETLWACGEEFDTHSKETARSSHSSAFDVEALLKEFEARRAKDEEEP